MNAPAREAIARLIDMPEDTSQGKQEVRYAVVGLGEIVAVRQLLGVSVEGYVHAIDKSAINHILKKHGQGREWRKNHIPITRDDILRLPEIVASPDSIGPPDEGVKSGAPCIRYKKRFNGITFYVAEVRRGKKNQTLSAVSMWKVATGAKDVHH